MVKKTMILLGIVVLMTTNFLPSYATQVETITVGYAQTTTHTYVMDYTQTYQLIYEYFNDMYSVTGIKFEFVAYEEDELVQQLVSGNVDIVALSIKDEYINEYMDDGFLEYHYYSAFNGILDVDLGAFYAFTMNEELLLELESGSSYLLQDSDYYENLIDTYFNSKNESEFSLQLFEWSLLNEKDVFTVAYDTDCFPFSYSDAQGVPDGISIDIMYEIAAILDINIEFIDIDEALESGADINLSVFTNKQFENHSVSSIAYLSFPIVVVGHEVIYDFNEYNAGYLDQTLFNYATFLPESSTAFTCYDDLEEALYKGEIDCIIATSAMAQNLLDDNEDYVISSIGEQLYCSMTFSDDLEYYYTYLFDKAIASLDVDVIDTIVLLNFSQEVEEETFIDFLYQYRTEIIASLLFATVIIICFYNENRNKLLNLLNIDPLTGLFTERKFLIEAKKLLKSNESNFSIVSFDIDNFKYINETMGYETGSEVIKLTAEHIKHVYGDKTLICRVYGDLFLIMTDKLNSEQKLICGREECSGCIGESLRPVLVNENIVKTSVGIYMVKDINESLSYMIDCAHFARRLGKNIYGHTRFIFDKEMEENEKARNVILSNMEEAIHNHEFYPLIQPKYDFKTGKVVGGEALVRWDNDDNIIKPDEFIPLFEQNGFIKELDFYVFERVCKFISRLDNPIKIAVNFSGATILEEDVVQKAIEIVKKEKIQPKYIEIEITEGVFSKGLDEILEKVNRLREYGFSIAMDDFGSGVSSLNRLRNISFDVLKIDKEFLGQNLIDDKGFIIINSIVSMAKSLGLIVVAEGVETKEQAKLLTEYGCDIAQGYYYSKPISMYEFKELYEKQ